MAISILILVGVAALLAAGSASAQSIEETLAIVQTGISHPPAEIVKEFDRVLTGLERKCQQQRTSTPGSVGLGDMAMKAVQSLANGGRSTTPAYLLHALNAAIPDEIGKRDCAPVLSALVLEMGGRK